jgi:hypothetical protein
MPPRRTRRQPPLASAPGRIRSHAEEIQEPPPYATPSGAQADPLPRDLHSREQAEETRRVRPDQNAQRPVVLAGAFSDASAAASYLGQLLDLVEANPTVCHGHEHWWVMGRIPLNLGRELIELADGRGYVRHGEQLIKDSGWGPPPRARKSGGVALDQLHELPVLDLIKAAGMHVRPASPREQVIALVPTARTSSLLRRALDLRLNATFRPVRLCSLFALEDSSEVSPPEPAQGTLIEVRLAGAGHDRQTRYVSETLIAALDADPLVLLCREVSPRLLIQYNRHFPLTDRQFEALVDGDTWVLADPPHGCWSLTPLADYASAWSMIRLSRSHQLAAGDESWPDHDLVMPFRQQDELTIVPAIEREGPIDAILLDDDDLLGLQLLLQGHPLAEFAAVVPGRDRHLLIAPGGILERMPLGEYLACVGPGPIYVAHGWRTEPRLPAVAWRQLLNVVPGQALVLEPNRTMLFDLGLRRPVWELWAGELPPFDLQLPDDATEVLSRIEDQLNAPAKVGKTGLSADAANAQMLTGATSPQQLTWRDQALEAELAGELLLAARLHHQNGELERAGRLYERAAYEGPSSVGSGSVPQS